ncbi:hypothetical protein [Pseudomonas maumuensis]|uniref:Uncharacterized protein n=1 Tax=Pseudomonas maumuensis TaxID=2842354 RepID=A0ABX8NJZ4_9PSED|nr:hypothetical protein [Pseudomonas maumuensis]QXH56336.1 hypothetical protein KSS90_23930 [Pseudomonas maumuensis]
MRELFTLLPGNAEKDAQISAGVVEESWGINVDLSSGIPSELSFCLPGKGEIRLSALRSEKYDVDGFKAHGWVGDASIGLNTKRPMDPLTWASLVSDGKKLVGRIHVDEQLYHIEPRGEGKHVLVKLDESKLPQDGGVMGEELKDDGVVLKASGITTINLLFVTTENSRVKHPEYKLHLLQALQDANQYFINSQVEICYQPKAFYDANYNEGGRGATELVRALRQGDVEGVVEKREKEQAHLVSMLIAADDKCGVSFLQARKENAFSVVGCFGALATHLALNIGVRTGWNEDAPIFDPPYARGYKHSSPEFHTIMVDWRDAIPYFSNPSVKYKGVPVGIVEKFDAARFLNERRGYIASFYPSK